jgi:hypothetical protein
MADITITAANVLGSAAVKKSNGTAGATITAGDVVYLDTAAGTYKLAIATAEATAKAAGIALCDAVAGQPFVFATFDSAFALGGTVVVGGAYVVSGAVAGAVAPIADLTTGAFATLLGIASSTSTIYLSTEASNRASAAVA